MSDIDRFSSEHWEKLLGDIDLEIVQTAVMCHVRLLDPGVAEAVLNRDPLVWHDRDEAGLTKLRGLLAMHFTAERQIADCIGPEQSAQIATRVREHLRARVGDQLGSPVA